MSEFKVDPSKYNYTCYIMAGGPSLRGFDWSRLTPDKFIIAVNRAYEVLPDAQVVYFTDQDYWQRHREAMMKHKGQLIRGVLNPERERKQMPQEVIIYHLTGPAGYETKPGKLKHGSNSTYAALNLAAAHFKFEKIYILGLDMKWGKPGDKSQSHWHDGHKGGRLDPESGYKKMIQAYDTIKQPLKDAGVEVYNANPDSAVKAFPRITIEEALK